MLPKYIIIVASIFVSAPANAEPALKECKGVFIRRSCMTAGGEGSCSYRQEKGTEISFMDWSLENGVKVYSIYRLGAYRASDIVLAPGCRLPRN